MVKIKVAMLIKENKAFRDLYWISLHTVHVTGFITSLELTSVQ